MKLTITSKYRCRARVILYVTEPGKKKKAITRRVMPAKATVVLERFHADGSAYSITTQPFNARDLVILTVEDSIRPETT